MLSLNSVVISFMFHNGAILYTQCNMFLSNICDPIIIYAGSVIPLYIITFLCCVGYYTYSVIPNVYYR